MSSSDPTPLELRIQRAVFASEVLSVAADGMLAAVRRGDVEYGIRLVEAAYRRLLEAHE